MLEILFWLIVFSFSLVFLIKGADWLIESSQKIAQFFGISSFIIGVTIVALGTSLPELASSICAVFKEATEIVPANVIGSNITNILLIVGLASVVTRSFLSVKRSLIDLDLPLLTAVTLLLGVVIFDGRINFREAIFLLLTFLIYFLYTLYHRKEETSNCLPEEETGSSPLEKKETYFSKKESKKEKIETLNLRIFLILIFGILLLGIGAEYLIRSTLKLAEIFKIPVSVIAIFGISVGTSLPELVVSVRSAGNKRYEIALGNIFGSNVFNSLVVIGIPALIRPLFVDEITLKIGFHFMLIATLMLVISGITRRISVWEGAMFLILYFLFLAKLFHFC